MNKIIAGLFAAVIACGVVRADVGVAAKDLEQVIDQVNYVETAQEGVVLEGYVDAGYLYNFISDGEAVNTRAAADGYAKGDFNINAVKLALEKALGDANELAAGFRVDLMLGEDVSSIGSAGQNPAGTNSDDIFLEQAYVQVRAPWGNGVDFKVGKFVTLLGYEVIERPSNLNITYGNLFNNAIPLVHAGAVASYAFNDIVDMQFGIVNGYNTDDGLGGNGLDVNDDTYALTGSINFTNPGGNANLYTAFYLDPTFGDKDITPGLGAGNGDDTNYIIDSWGNWAPKFANDKLLLGINGNFGVAEANPGLGDTTWYGAALYAKYQFTDIFSLAGRADWLHEDGAVKWNTYPGAGGNNDLYSLTLTAGFDILENLLLRAEYRLDHGDNIVGTAGGIGTDDWAHTAAVQAVYTF